MLSLQFARRYLFSKKSHSVINLISGVSVLAMAMPVAAMIILLSVFNGFEEVIKSMASAFDADLCITPQRGVAFPSSDLDTTRLKEVEGVEALSFIVEQNALVRYRDRQQQVTLRGVEAGYQRLLPITAQITEGGYWMEEGGEQAIIGRSLAYTLGMRSREQEPLSIYALKRNGFSSILPIDGYKRHEVMVGGYFNLDAESESRYLLLPRQTVEELFQMEGRSTALLIRVKNPARIKEVQQRIAATVGDTFRVRTRYELRPSFYDIMTYEKWGIFFIALLVLILASFSMVGALVMLILEKREEETTLRALGADTRFIRRIFLAEGGVIGGFGALLGVLFGVGITLLQQYWGVIKMPVQTLVVKSYPIAFHWGDLAATLIAFAAVVMIISQLTVRSMIRPPKTKNRCNMIRKILIFCLFAICITGCKKHTIIPDDELALIFHDAFLANSYYKDQNLKRDSLLIYEPIFSRYGYTTEDVQYTIGNFSKRKSARLGDVVELAIEMLEKEGARLDKAVADLDTINNVARRYSERSIFRDSLIRVTRLKDTAQLYIAFEDVRPGDYRISARYEIDSLDENTGLRFQYWMERLDSTMIGIQSVLLRREHEEEITRILKADTAIHRIVFNFWQPRIGAKRQKPSITLRDVEVYYKLTAEEAVDSLYEKELNIRIFANDFLRQLQADSLASSADTARVAKKAAH